MNEKLNKAMNQISDNYLQEVETYKKRRTPYWFGAVAAVLALVIGVSAIAGGLFPEPGPSLPIIQGSVPDAPEPSGIQSPGSLQLANLLAAPVYPEMVQRPHEDYNNYQEYTALLNAWKEDQATRYDQPDGYADSLTDFFRQSIPLFLKSGENSAYSPVNVYMALAMLAETTDGNSRQQVLDLLGLDSIEALREQVSHVWNAHYCDDGVTTLLLGNSLWLDEAFSFHQETVDRLANNYYASSFRGDLGTPAMNEQLQAWLNANTGGLLQEQAEKVEMDPSTVFALASTVYFAADWESEFPPENTQDMLFHCGEYDLMTPFMYQTLFYGTYYRGTNFGATYLELKGENTMWLILPDEGYTVEDILQSDEYLRLSMNPGSWKNKDTYRIHLRLPKFDVVSETDLAEGLQELGITDVFDHTISDFTPITDTPQLYVGGATHAARVTIDEEGCLAAAFTVLLAYGTGAPTPPPEMDFTLDRPFLFVISSRDNLPLFAGIVAEP